MPIDPAMQAIKLGQHAGTLRSSVQGNTHHLFLLLLLLLLNLFSYRTVSRPSIFHSMRSALSYELVIVLVLLHERLLHGTPRHMQQSHLLTEVTIDMMIQLLQIYS